MIARRKRRMARRNPRLSGDPFNLRWVVRSSAPPGAEGEVWGDAHFANDLGEALRDQGLYVEVSRRGEPLADADVVIDLRGLYRLPRVENAVNILWVISHPDLVADDELRQYDLIFAAGPAWAARRGRETQVDIRPLLQATASTRFGPDAAEGQPRRGVVFVGATRNAYRPAVMWSIEAGVEVELHGHGWEEFVEADRIRSQHLPNSDLPRVYARADLVLNDHWTDMAREGFISNRVFDAAAAGAVVVTDRVSGVEQVSADLVRVFHDPASLQRAVELATPDQDTRRAAAAAVQAAHSFHARAQVLTTAVTGHLRRSRAHRRRI